jgi:hypothetical protein
MGSIALFVGYRPNDKAAEFLEAGADAFMCASFPCGKEGRAHVLHSALKKARKDQIPRELESTRCRTQNQ